MKIVKIAAVAAALFTAAQAQAATLLYSLTGGYTASFQLSSNPTPSVSDPFDFLISGVTGTYPSASNADIVFFGTFGGLSILPSSGVGGSFSGPKLFTGPANAPTMLTGTFALIGTNNATLTVTDISAVPEPASWAMMIAGFGVAGAALRRRKISAKVSFA